MGNYLIATVKSWNIENYNKLEKQYPEHNFFLFTEKEKLICQSLFDIQPEYIFFPHWSWMIPQEIFENFHCVVFHMTDVPFGRGGSPLQNLIIRGIYHTKISAIRVVRELDAGPVYFKKSLDIRTGSADDILQNASDIIFQQMIPSFFQEKVIPMEQRGENVIFKRRTQKQSEIPEGLSQRQLYDYIRMLDGEGYPTAYRNYGKGKVYYRNARIENGIVYADAEFRRND